MINSSSGQGGGKGPRTPSTTPIHPRAAGARLRLLLHAELSAVGKENTKLTLSCNPGPALGTGTSLLNTKHV